MGSDYELKCPKCGGMIDYDDIYDSSSGENYRIDYCVGHCIECDAEFQWQEKFKTIFEGVEKFEEVK